MTHVSEGYFEARARRDGARGARTREGIANWLKGRFALRCEQLSNEVADRAVLHGLRGDSDGAVLLAEMADHWAEVGALEERMHMNRLLTLDRAYVNWNGVKYFKDDPEFR